MQAADAVAKITFVEAGRTGIEDLRQSQSVRRSEA